jgi:methylenetetrahydrofolate dehydrogenase (NADP+)/methenyltetrahydrofolate cyclohydrolase
MQKISGEEVSRDIIGELKRRAVPKRILAAISVGDNPASDSFLKRKQVAAGELGVDLRLYKLPITLGNDGIRKKVGELGLSKKVGGVILQLPLPTGIDKNYVVNAIPREKDVDVLSERALGAFWRGRNSVLPPAVGVVNEILDRQNINLKDISVAVVGLGDLVGKPVSVWLSGKCKELTLLDRDSDLEILGRADLIISGVGCPGVVKSAYLKEGAGVIDFGYYYSPEGKLLGDLETTDDLPEDGFYTPTPKGTGPILVAKLMENFYKLCEDKTTKVKGNV